MDSSLLAKTLIHHLFYKINYNKKIKDFYCINDKMITSSLEPRLKTDRRGRYYLICKCEKCGNDKSKYIPHTINIYKDSEDDEDDEDDKDDEDDEDDKRIKLI